ncbi:hypothetical protein H8959_001632 [Pygathrix nigripes]
MSNTLQPAGAAESLGKVQAVTGSLPELSRMTAATDLAHVAGRRRPGGSGLQGGPAAQPAPGLATLPQPGAQLNSTAGASSDWRLRHRYPEQPGAPHPPAADSPLWEPGTAGLGTRHLRARAGGGVDSTRRGDAHWLLRNYREGPPPVKGIFYRLLAAASVNIVAVHPGSCSPAARLAGLRRGVRSGQSESRPCLPARRLREFVESPVQTSFKVEPLFSAVSLCTCLTLSCPTDYRKTFLAGEHGFPVMWEEMDSDLQGRSGNQSQPVR